VTELENRTQAAGRRRHYAVTALGNATVVISGLILVRLIARASGTAVFGEFQIADNLVATLQPALLLGLGVGVSRFVAQGLDDPSVDEFGYVVIALKAVSLPLIAASIILLGAPQALSRLLLGSAEHAALVRALSLDVAGIVLSGIVYSYFRGRLQFGRASIFQTAVMGFIPLASFVVVGAPHGSLADYFGLAGSAWIVLSAIILIPRLCRRTRRTGRADARALLSYSLPRTVGAIMLVPAVLAADLLNLTTAGYFGLATSAVLVSGSAFTVISSVALPHVVIMLAHDQKEQVTEHLARLIVLVVGITLAAMLATPLLSHFVIVHYLGRRYAGASFVLDVMSLSFLPYAIYIAGRSPIDAYHTQPVNTYHLLLSGVGFIVAVVPAQHFLHGIDVVACPFLISMYILGGATYARLLWDGLLPLAIWQPMMCRRLHRIRR
jgi:O-antigen/teichoic acid export membrane protein